MKKISILLILIIIFSISSFASYADNAVKVNVDGKPLSFDTPPQLVNGWTMVPLRDILEALGLQLSYDDKTKIIMAVNKDYTIVLPVGSQTALVNGKAVKLDAPASIVNGKTMVPVRFISESVGADVKWEASSRTVNISSADYSRRVSNTNNLSNINNSSVNVTNNNVDNSVNNSNNTINNYDYSTNITNNITNNVTNNYTVNGMTEDLLKQILNKLMGTDFIKDNPVAGAGSSNSNTGTGEANGVNPDSTVVNLSEAPVILPLDKQPDAAWKDGVITYDELVHTNLRIAFTLPKGIGTGKTDKNGLNSGYTKFVELVDENGNHLGRFPSSVEKLELEKGIAVLSLNPWIFKTVKDGQTLSVTTYIEKDGELFSDYSNAISFVFKEGPNALKIKEMHISSVFKPSPEEVKLFEATGEPVSLIFMLKVHWDSSGKENGAITYAMNRSIHISTLDFVLRADGYPDVPAFRSGDSMGSQKGTLFALTVSEPEKLVRGVTYKLVPVNQNPDAQWVVDAGVSYTPN